jgi:hypothetical protein
MWESKTESIDVNYNIEHLWFDGINGQHVQKPNDIRKLEESKCHKLIERTFPRVKADKMLSDLSAIALEWAKSYVRQRETFKLNTKGENMAPMAFQNDPDGTYLALAAELRNQEHPFNPRESSFALSFEPIEEEGGEETDLEESSSTPDSRSERTLPAAPLRSRDPRPSIRALSGTAKEVPATPEVEMANRYKH